MANNNFLDDNGQPVNPWFNHARVQQRTTDELIGLCKGILADGQVVQAEAEFLLSWLHTNHIICHEYPARRILERLAVFLEDGHLDDEEARELKELLLAFTGLKPDELLHGANNPSSRLPLDDPMPQIEFVDKTFCFTGALTNMVRSKAAQAVEDKGGKATKSISKKVDYVVIGCLGSRDWLHSTHGTKIKAALKLREQGEGISIISEEHWLRHL